VSATRETGTAGRIVGHGGCGRLDAVYKVGFSNRILRYINFLGYIRQTLINLFMNNASY